MTSKEALECIVVDLVPLAKEHNKEEIEQIEKDLEILDILKKHLLFAYNGTHYGVKIHDMDDETADKLCNYFDGQTTDKIKEESEK